MEEAESQRGSQEVVKRKRWSHEEAERRSGMGGVMRRKRKQTGREESKTDEKKTIIVSPQ